MFIRDNTKQNNMPPTTPPPKDWHQYFQAEAVKPEYGTFDKFDDPPRYLGSIKEFKEQVTSNTLETTIIIPGPDKTVRLLHNCTVDDETNRVNDIFGTKQFSPLKQAAIGALVKPFVSHTTNRTDTKPNIPSVEDFMECTSGAEELLELVETGNDTIDKLEKIPQSFWIHPHLLTAYVTQRQSKIESIGDSFVLAIEDMDDNSATKLTEQYYRFLVFIWAIGNGHARTQIKLSDPPDDDTTDLLLEKAQEKFRSNKAREGKGSDDSENEAEKNEAEKDDNDRPRHNHERSSSREGHQTTRPRSPARRRNHRDNTNTRGLRHSRRRARGRHSRSNTRSRSRGRGSPSSSSSSGSSRDRGRDRNVVTGAGRPTGAVSAAPMIETFSVN
jgi:hypothetical protein